MRVIFLLLTLVGAVLTPASALLGAENGCLLDGAVAAGGAGALLGGAVPLLCAAVGGAGALLGGAVAQLCAAVGGAGALLGGAVGGAVAEAVGAGAVGAGVEAVVLCEADVSRLLLCFFSCKRNWLVADGAY